VYTIAVLVDSSNAPSSSSISDTEAYRVICTEAARDPAVFRSFKQDPRYQLVLEHVTPGQGAAYLMAVLEQSPHLATHLESFRRNDSLGGPSTFDFGPGIGVFSPTTCRYAKVLSDLLLMFGDLTGMRIVEVGGGYGGQCFIIHSLCKPASYTIVDLPPALALQERYLDQLGVKGVSFLSIADLPASLPSDLFMSSYALTECIRPVTDVYLEKIVRAADRGYVTGNRIGTECYTQRELMEKIPESIAVEEVPRTGPHNYLLVWKTIREAARPFAAGV
jgi:hypothetical protein